VRILVVSGSLRAASYNTALARAAVALAPAGVDVELYEGLGELPPYDGDLDDEFPPDAVADLRAQIELADGLLMVTPEYNGSTPGVLKNAVDWASRPRDGAALYGKTVAVAGATTGQYGAIWAQQDLRRVLGLAGARVIEGDMPVSRAQDVFDQTGRLLDRTVAERLGADLANLVEQSIPVALAA
jgi:chromate reductase